MPNTTTENATRDRVLRFARKLPTAPQIFGRLGMMLNNMNTELEDIVKLTSVDAGLTSRVLRMSNSIFFRGDSPVSTLEEAIGRVGFRELHKIVGVAMTDQVFQSGLPVYHLSAEQVWENSVVTALAMERLARECGEDDSVAYTVGLLRPVGKLVLDMLIEIEQPGVACPESATLDLPTWERAWSDTTSNDVGAMILEDWRLPEVVSLGVKHHYQPDDTGGRMGALLHIACWIAKELGKGLQVESSQWILSDDVLARAGLRLDAVTNCMKETEEALVALKDQLKAA